VVRLLEQAPLPTLELQQIAQVPRVEQELLAGPALPAGAERHGVDPDGEPLHDREQLQRAERLQEQRVRADLLRRRLVRLVGARQEHDRDVLRRTRSLQPRAERRAVETRHAHVEHDCVRPRGGDSPLGGRGVRSLVDLDVHGLERRAQKRSKAGIVVDEQEAQCALLYRRLNSHSVDLSVSTANR
jgi:hypothetical protein